MPLPVRRPIRRGGARRVRRRRSPLNRWRVLGAMLMMAAGGAFGWLVSADDFAVDAGAVRLSQLRYTDPHLVRLTMAPWLAGTPNLFALPAAEVERALAGLPAVADSRVRAVLPDGLVVELVERVPVFVWRTADGDFLVDSSGVLLRAAAAGDPLAADLPVLNDERERVPVPGVGGSMEPVDLAAVLKLAAVDPPLLGSGAAWLTLSADDENGYVLAAAPRSWRAIFGHYTPTLRPPDIIDQQVQCLRALLGDEEQLLTVYLAPADDRCGTFVARPTAAPDDE